MASFMFAYFLVMAFLSSFGLYGNEVEDRVQWRLFTISRFLFSTREKINIMRELLEISSLQIAQKQGTNRAFLGN